MPDAQVKFDVVGPTLPMTRRLIRRYARALGTERSGAGADKSEVGEGKATD
jgi:hypothetical protein